jgi:hypothetical protein
MNKLNELFKSITEAFTLRKKVDFEDLKISITLQNLTAIEELKVLEACKDFDGGAYLEAVKKSSLAYSIKKINEFIFDDSEIAFEDNTGNMIKESKYLFLLHQIENWPAAVRDVLFDAFNNMHIELENQVNSKVKFERFTVQPPPSTKTKEIGSPEGFRRLEKEEDEPLEETEVDKLNRRVAEEQAQAQTEINKTEKSYEQK